VNAPHRALIVDSALRSRGGHNFSYTQAIRRGLSRLGWECDVLANRGLASDLQQEASLRPTFSFGAYDFPPLAGTARELEYVHAQGAVFGQELEATLRGGSGMAYGLVFSHTLGDFELVGWSRFLSRRPLAGRLAILLRRTSGFARCSWARRRFHPYWRLRPRYLSEIRKKMGGRFTFLTDSALLSADYRVVYPHPIVTAPIPVGVGLLDLPLPTAVRRRDVVSIGYLGDARPAKGFHLLPGLVESVLESGAAVRFLIQCAPNASDRGGDSSAGAVKALRALAEKWSGGVELVEGSISESDYARAFARVDIVLLPYLHTNYLAATSGIFAEAVALARPVIVPRKTWMSAELARAGSGFEFDPMVAGDLFDKVVRAVREYPELEEKARRLAPAWRAFHNEDMLASVLLAESGADAPPTDSPTESRS